jgi:hypothetical protein
MACRLLRYFCVVVSVSPLSAMSAARGQALKHYESPYLWLGEYPHDRETSYSDHIQGVAHDDQNWFLSQKGVIRKIPVDQDLANPQESAHLEIWTIQPLLPDGTHYVHFGDIDYHRDSQGHGYVVVPIEPDAASQTRPPVIAFLSAEDLHFVGYFRLEYAEHHNCAWVAVDPQTERIYTSDWDVVYSFILGSDPWDSDWDVLQDITPPNYEVPHGPGMGAYLCNESGERFIDIQWAQGGEFSESGELFYFTCGSDGWGDDPDRVPQDGINVFQVDRDRPGIGFPGYWRRLRRSWMDTMPFQYHWEPGWSLYQEPEGLTVWDLDNRNVPGGISGQLHVVMYENDGGEIFFKHYTCTIHVDGSYAGTPDYGRPNAPFKTIADAYAQAWDGQRIAVRAGSYPETLTFSKRIEVVANGGPVVIGR